MITGAPWPPPSAPAAKTATNKTFTSRVARRLPAVILVLVCGASITCVLLLVILPTIGAAAPLGSAYALSSGGIPSPATGWGSLVAYLILWTFAAISAVSVARVPPGHIPLWLYSREPGDQAYFHNVLQAVEKKLDGSLRFCRKCGAFKPDLAHHSRELGLCILCYQHWDIWSNNAIGFYNHKMYLLALGYGALAHALTAALLLPGVLHATSAGGIGAAELPARVLLTVIVGGDGSVLTKGDSSVLAFACISLFASTLLGLGSLCALRPAGLILPPCTHALWPHALGV